MRYTNKHNLPEYVKLWLESDDYDYKEGIVSATTLIAPARQYALYQWHKDKLEIDISELIASRYGTAIHSAFEVVDMPNIIKEQRLFHELEVNGKKFNISGKFDMLADTDKDKQKLVDIKSTSVWSYIFSSKVEDYVKQLSIYKYLGNKNGYNIGCHAEICMVFTDWSKKKAKQDINYPSLRVAIKPIVLWKDEDTEAFIRARLELLDAAVEKRIELPECSQKELWQKEDKWEVAYPSSIKPITVCNSEAEARSYMTLKLLNGKALIRQKKGMVKRCGYCLARNFCDQYKRLLQEGRIEQN